MFALQMALALGAHGRHQSEYVRLDALETSGSARCASIAASSRSGTESSQTHCWRGESRANQSLNVGLFGAGELGPDSERFMDDFGSVRAPFEPGIGRDLGLGLSAGFSGDVALSSWWPFCFCFQWVSPRVNVPSIKRVATIE